jgi:hypothetical protein
MPSRTLGVTEQGAETQAWEGEYQNSRTTPGASVTVSWYQVALLIASHVYVGVRVAIGPEGALGCGVGTAGSTTSTTALFVVDHGP